MRSDENLQPIFQASEDTGRQTPAAVMYQVAHVENLDHAGELRLPYMCVDRRTNCPNKQVEVLARKERTMVEGGNRGEIPGSGDHCRSP